MTQVEAGGIQAKQLRSKVKAFLDASVSHRNRHPYETCI